MINHIRLSHLLFGVTVFLLAVLLCGVAMAADCQVLHDGIRKERVLMKKKALVEAALKQCPKNSAIAYQDGYIFERLRKYEDALVRYRRAIALDSSYAKAYFSIGDIQTLQKNYTEAFNAYSTGLRYDPGNDRARVSLEGVRAKSKAALPKKISPPPVAAVAEKKKAEPVKKVAKVAPKFAEAPITRLNVPFAEQTISLSQDARDVLSVVVGQALNRKDMRKGKFEIGGHTDNTGDEASNADISKKRALSVQKFLRNNFGIDSDRLKIAHYGSKKPKVPNNSAANQAINRRVDFTKID